MSTPGAPIPLTEQPAPAPASLGLLPWLVAVAFFMESLDTTILNTAVPAVAEALHVGPLAMKAVLASYTLALAVFIPISGWMADRFGTRRVFASAIGLFTLGSLLCGLCSNIHLLVACRVVQGMGGAMMVPVGRLTLVRSFAKADLLRVMSFVSVPALVAPMLGPVAGGLIVGYAHWRVIFFLNIPIGLLGLVMVYLHLPDFREEHIHKLDFVGLVLFGSGIALLSYVLEVFGEHELSGREMTGLLAVSGSLLAAYWVHARQLQFPLLNLRLFDIRTFRVSVNGSFFTRLGIGGSALPDGTGVYAGAVGNADCAAGSGGDGHEGDSHEAAGEDRLQGRAGGEHGGNRIAAADLHDDSSAYAGVADCGDRFLLWSLHEPAIHNHEYAGVRGYRGAGRFKRQLDCEHDAADGDQLWRGVCGIDDGVLCAGEGVLGFGVDD